MVDYTGKIVLYSNKYLNGNKPRGAKPDLYQRAHFVVGMEGKHLIAWKVDRDPETGFWKHPALVSSKQQWSGQKMAGFPGYYPKRFRTLEQIAKEKNAFTPKTMPHGSEPTAVFKMDSFYRLATPIDMIEDVTVPDPVDDDADLKEILRWALPFLEGYDHVGTGSSPPASEMREYEDRLEQIREILQVQRYWPQRKIKRYFK